MFSENDCFRLKQPLEGEAIPVGALGVVLLVLDGVGGQAYEVEFPDGQGGNLGSEITFTINEDFMEPVPRGSTNVD